MCMTQVTSSDLTPLLNHQHFNLYPMYTPWSPRGPCGPCGPVSPGKKKQYGVTDAKKINFPPRLYLRSSFTTLQNIFSGKIIDHEKDPGM